MGQSSWVFIGGTFYLPVLYLVVVGDQDKSGKMAPRVARIGETRQLLSENLKRLLRKPT
jgi:hypothetical protein